MNCRYYPTHPLGAGNVDHPTANIERPTVLNQEHSMFGVRCWPFEVSFALGARTALSASSLLRPVPLGMNCRYYPTHPLGAGNVDHPTANIERPTVLNQEHSMLGVRCWPFEVSFALGARTALSASSLLRPVPAGMNCRYYPTHPLGAGNVDHPTANIERPTVLNQEHSMLGVRCWPFEVSWS